MDGEPAYEIIPLLKYTKDKTVRFGKKARRDATREQEEEERSSSSSSSSKEEDAPSSLKSKSHPEFEIRRNASVQGGGDLLKSG